MFNEIIRNIVRKKKNKLKFLVKHSSLYKEMLTKMIYFKLNIFIFIYLCTYNLYYIYILTQIFLLKKCYDCWKRNILEKKKKKIKLQKCYMTCTNKFMWFRKISALMSRQFSNFNLISFSVFINFSALFLFTIDRCSKWWHF